MADRWEQFKRAKDVADAWVAGSAGLVGDAATGVYRTIERRLSDPRLPSETENLGADAFNLGPGLMLPGGVARAAAGRAASEIGVAAGKIMQRADAQKLAREMLAQGKSAREVAEALNTRFAPLLDEGSQVTKGMVEGRRHRGEYDVGAMGGGGRMPRTRSADEVAKLTDELATWLEREGVPVRVKGSSGGTNYIKLPDPTEGQLRPEIRVGDHGQPHARAGVLDFHPHGHPLNSRDMGGRPLADPENLKTTATNLFPPERFKLTPDDSTMPRWTRYAEEPRATAPEGGPVADPRQLKLLSGGAPAPSNWQTTVQPAQEELDGAGRFARPLMDQDAALIARAREMTERVRQQQRTIWDQFERVDAYDPR